jgi:hypothetical protein
VGEDGKEHPHERSKLGPFEARSNVSNYGKFLDSKTRGKFQPPGQKVTDDSPILRHFPTVEHVTFCQERTKLEKVVNGDWFTQS